MGLHAAPAPAGGGELNPQEAGLFALGRARFNLLRARRDGRGCSRSFPRALPSAWPRGISQTYEASPVLRGVEHVISDGRCTATGGSTRVFERRPPRQPTGTPTFQGLVPECVCAVKRKPLRDPGWVAKELRTTKKSREGDANLVDGLYRDYFDR